MTYEHSKPGQTDLVSVLQFSG